MRLSVPKVTRMIYDKPSFVELDEGWALPKELEGLVLGTEFGGEIDEVVWPSALERIVFWRRCKRVLPRRCCLCQRYTTTTVYLVCYACSRTVGAYSSETRASTVGTESHIVSTSYVWGYTNNFQLNFSTEYYCTVV